MNRRLSLDFARALIACIPGSITILNEATLQSALLSVYTREQYEPESTLSQRVSTVGYSITMNHALSDWNKRFAVIAMNLYMLEQEKRTLCEHWPEGELEQTDIETILGEDGTKEILEALARVAAGGWNQTALEGFMFSKVSDAMKKDARKGW